jgi:hypothetical protein
MDQFALEQGFNRDSTQYTHEMDQFALGQHMIASTDSHEILEHDAEGLPRVDVRHIVVHALAPRLAVLDEGVHDNRLAHPLHRDVVARPLAALEQLLARLVADRLALARRLPPAQSR